MSVLCAYLLAFCLADAQIPALVAKQTLLDLYTAVARQSQQQDTGAGERRFFSCRRCWFFVFVYSAAVYFTSYMECICLFSTRVRIAFLTPPLISAGSAHCQRVGTR